MNMRKYIYVPRVSIASPEPTNLPNSRFSLFRLIICVHKSYIFVLLTFYIIEGESNLIHHADTATSFYISATLSHANAHLAALYTSVPSCSPKSHPQHPHLLSPHSHIHPPCPFHTTHARPPTSALLAKKHCRHESTSPVFRATTRSKLAWHTTTAATTSTRTQRAT